MENWEKGKPTEKEESPKKKFHCFRTILSSWSKKFSGVRGVYRGGKW